MARSSTQATTESDVASPAAEERLEIDDDTLRGKKYRKCIRDSVGEYWTQKPVPSSTSRSRLWIAKWNGKYSQRLFNAFEVHLKSFKLYCTSTEHYIYCGIIFNRTENM